MLRETGFPEIADEALRVLPDPVDEDQIAAFLVPYAALLVDNVNRLRLPAGPLTGMKMAGAYVARRRRYALAR